MKITTTNRTTWLSLYEAAQQFNELAPWAWMHDSDLFGVQDPVSGETGWCIIMGNLGECFALGTYWGNEGYASYQQILDAHEEDASEIDRIKAGLEQKMLKVEFVDREEISKEDLEHFKSLDIKFRGAKNWVQVRELMPGFHPWYANDQQAAYLVHTLQQAMDVAARFRYDRKLLHPAGGKLLVRVPVKTPEGISWEDQYREAPQQAEKVRKVNASLVQQAKKTSKKQKAAICFSISYMPGGIRGEKGKPSYFCQIGLWIQYGSGFIIGFDLFQPGELEIDFEEKFFEKLSMIGMLPQQLVVNSLAALDLVQPFTDALGIELIHAPNEEVFEEAMSAFSHFGM